MNRLLCLLAVTTLAALCATAALADDDRVNPHDRDAACLSCHEAGETDAAPGPALPSIPTCEGCHPDVKMHAVGDALRTTRVPEGWPLEDDVVTCATCHAEPSCDDERSKEPPWNRGGPYPDEKAMCWECHVRTDYQREDPHHPEARKDPNDPSCTVCHDLVPAEGAAPGDSGLRLQDEDLCGFCHEDAQHSGMEAHMGVKVESLDPEARSLVALDPEGKIACWTCHEVHGDGVGWTEPKPGKPAGDSIRELIRSKDWAGLLPDDVVWPGTTARDRHLPLLGLAGDGPLCSACHGDGP